MNFLHGIEPHYMWLYWYYIDDLQSFLLYSMGHEGRTEEEWLNMNRRRKNE